jgi:hypothetical protein
VNHSFRQSRSSASYRRAFKENASANIQRYSFSDWIDCVRFELRGVFFVTTLKADEPVMVTDYSHVREALIFERTDRLFLIGPTTSTFDEAHEQGEQYPATELHCSLGTHFANPTVDKYFMATFQFIEYTI